MHVPLLFYFSSILRKTSAKTHYFSRYMSSFLLCVERDIKFILKIFSSHLLLPFILCNNREWSPFDLFLNIFYCSPQKKKKRERKREREKEKACNLLENEVYKLLLLKAISSKNFLDEFKSWEKISWVFQRKGKNTKH